MSTARWNSSVAVQARKAVLANVLDYLALAIALEGNRTMSSASCCSTSVDSVRSAPTATPSSCTRRPARTAIPRSPRSSTSLAVRRSWPGSVRSGPDAALCVGGRRLRALLEGAEGTLDEMIDQLLERIALSSSEADRFREAA